MSKSRNGSIKWLFPVLLYVLFMFLTSGIFDDSESELTMDQNMETQYFNTDIVIGGGQSYKVTENIGVSFYTGRQGIYRHIPYKGTVVDYDQEDNLVSVPYYAKITEAKANEPLEVSRKNGSWLGRLGTEGEYKTGGEYQISYTFTPQFETKDYNNAYYNVFPKQWQNDIPAGSRFTVTFPKDFDHDRLKFYYGEQGERSDAADILALSWEGNTVTGVLQRDLPMGNGVTFYAPMKEGYFTGIGHVDFLPWMLLLPGVVLCALIVFLYLKFGRDEQIIPSVQYQPPDNLDSAAVGYIIDDNADNKDMISLIIYWAEQGYLRIEEQKSNNLCLYKLKDIPKDAPGYQITIFKKLFGRSDKRKVNSLTYNFAGTLDIAKKQLKNSIEERGGLYTAASRISRWVAAVCCTLPFGWFMLVTGRYSLTGTIQTVIQVILWGLLAAGTFVFCTGVDKWYAKSAKSRRVTIEISAGMCLFAVSAYVINYILRVYRREIFQYVWVLFLVVIMTGIMVAMAGFMKKRTPKCVEWMGKLAGLRDFIETAELERMNELAKTNPEWFYHIIPYAYVFGLSDVFAEKLKDLSLPAPEWYVPYHQYTFFDYYVFNSLMVNSFDKAATQLSVPKPSSSGSSGGSSGGSFGGGGGGFSGGGFGGGGGGSW
ncbi:DUF2207 domain-containing protein [Muricomes intestini]|jgi:uncharacterized membrane protein YgcG|uniref:DUF2207 domain-containing protein n=1 Tax=Muricomes intestini TaxID=1796634 RepID=UPI0026ABDB9B